MADLLGADLPAAGGGDGDGPGGGARFAWADGPLLAALRAGDWILLEELNLATQSVLEGLNSVLDHRRSVFLPELGVTVDAAPGFAAFGAQNAASDGGGRRALPRSFVSRFTRVHADPLTEGDLAAVAATLHPRLPARVVGRMTRAVVALAAAADRGGSSTRGDGLQPRLTGPGGPWEFNLRDLVRWCDVVAADAGRAASGVGDDDDSR